MFSFDDAEIEECFALHTDGSRVDEFEKTCSTPSPSPPSPSRFASQVDMDETHPPPPPSSYQSNKRSHLDIAQSSSEPSSAPSKRFKSSSYLPSPPPSEMTSVISQPERTMSARHLDSRSVFKTSLPSSTTAKNGGRNEAPPSATSLSSPPTLPSDDTKTLSLSQLSPPSPSPLPEKTSVLETSSPPPPPSMFNEAQIAEINENYEFYLVILNCTPFKKMIEMCCHSLENLQFLITRFYTDTPDNDALCGQDVDPSRPSFKGITFNVSNGNNVAMICSRLSFDEFFPQKINAIPCCFNVKQLYQNLRNTVYLHDSTFMTLKKLKGDNTFTLTFGTGSNTQTINTPILNEIQQGESISILLYKHVIHIETKLLVSLAQTATSKIIDAPYMRFQIFYKVDPNNKIQYNRTKISYSKEQFSNRPPIFEQVIDNATVWSDVASQMTEITCSVSSSGTVFPADMGSPVIDQWYQSLYINLFVKSIEEGMITMFMGEDLPMIIFCKFIDEEVGFLYYILAGLSLTSN